MDVVLRKDVARTAAAVEIPSSLSCRFFSWAPRWTRDQVWRCSLPDRRCRCRTCWLSAASGEPKKHSFMSKKTLVYVALVIAVVATVSGLMFGTFWG